MAGGQSCGRARVSAERDREITEIDDRARCPQEVHPDDPAELEAVVHPTDLDVEAIEAVIADFESIDAPQEHVFVAAKLRGASQLIGRLEAPASAARSALITVLAAPVSTRTSGISTVVPRYVSLAVT
jgi:hypothetical protein